MSNLNINTIRADFPVLHQEINGFPLVYLDNAATSQKPRQVIEAVSHYYLHDNANIHRGVHKLSQRATDLYEAARAKVRQFVNANSDKEIIFTRGATEAINLVAQSFVRPMLQPDDEILISHLEHHANIVPWQILCEQTGAKLKVIPMTQSGELDLTDFDAMLTERTRILAVGQVSNALGTINPVKSMIARARAKNIPVLIDGAQAVPHMTVDVQDLDCDFYVFSGHKMFAPTGIGALYGRKDLLNAMPPYQGGGDMILSVSFEKTIYNELPAKFEAGTPNISGVIGLGAAIDYMWQIGIDNIAAQEHHLLDIATRKIEALPGVRIIGTAAEKAAVISFMIEGVHPHDVGTIFDQQGVAIRTGHHCAQPVMEFYDIPATARASFAFYNSEEEVDALINAIQKTQELFA
ncbi:MULTISPECIES: cysteine desulfurase [unclassified Methylophaga]|jgi:cysteine desulfurase/selenocysteine lyase|uniref:cysteine desulfurase n=1 Tax=unclassified Methylophaga TaxID=2629249 RepID=UPI000C953412|nr:MULTISPECIES: cysteine desulfurase [unclassified Methylophaga]MAK65795.1 cysteine desulfurase CsdA [Methylophaga sp.]MAY16519.1 cysteine desulfurase CsdA [Methylophaga sp.]HCD05678.1 cysteine desulfurase CsdA [Methylophaga sp.]|tara:strand:+ start:17435 stop:18658 length:1224 start_codon:yes stop_codon:yes gene_type:complete